MTSWPGTFLYQPTLEQAPCACNQNYYDQIVACLACQSSDSAKLQAKPLPDYKLVCQSLGQPNFPPIYMPSTSTSATSTNSPAPSSGVHSSSGSSHSGLSPGAVAGIVVSAIALIVALSVAVYVFRRRREIRQKEHDDLYKYQEAAHEAYMDAPLPQYSGIQSSLPALPQLTNLRVMNPDNEEEEERINNGTTKLEDNNGLNTPQHSSPGWRRGSFDDD
ncbi:hypothetical protein BGZ65_006758 [Modicella reniformis]|uniref:Uncharacterized protein n=1 Tax=Modicella reniformis TaxID=1440133 RepID=A0A9P6MFK2_9FUNG|nr:hypothetical protein BGZ65_006758 [Modicella reniformis]